MHHLSASLIFSTLSLRNNQIIVYGFVIALTVSPTCFACCKQTVDIAILLVSRESMLRDAGLVSSSLVHSRSGDVSSIVAFLLVLYYIAYRSAVAALCFSRFC